VHSAQCTTQSTQCHDSIITITIITIITIIITITPH
jgi:hypothetical protein